MAVARYHITPSGPKLCSASIRSCPYGGEENHFVSNRDAKQKYAETAEQIFRVNQPAAKTLTLGQDFASTEKIVQSDNWGAAISDLIDDHIENTSVKPEQIKFLLYWDEASINDDPAHTRRYLFEAVPRLDDNLGKFTNIYRLAWWNPTDDKAQAAIDSIYAREEGRDSRWAKIPDHMKWEAALGESLPEVDMNKNDWSEHYRKREAMTAKNNAESRAVLNNANLIDLSTLTRKLRDPNQVAFATFEDAQKNKGKAPERTAVYRYERSLERRANDILGAMQATENSLIGPYDSYDRGLGFYRLDDDRRTVVDENLSSTFVRGRHLQQLGLDSQRWLNGAWKGDIDKGGNTLNSQEAFARVAYSTDKGVPFQSPMTFWTANTPDGARWELGLDVSSPEAGSNRVRYFDAANPNIPVEKATPSGPIEGFAAMRESMEATYGESSNWSPALQRDMKVLADIAEGHSVMQHSAKTARERMEKYGAQKKVEASKEEHNSLFGSLGKLFG